jgi:hypothetical protein
MLACFTECTQTPRGPPRRTEAAHRHPARESWLSRCEPVRGAAPLPACALSRVQDRGMTSHSAAEQYGAPPGSRVGEHQVRATRPSRELGEIRRPGRQALSASS